jgi:hypothetical protein
MRLAPLHHLLHHLEMHLILYTTIPILPHLLHLLFLDPMHPVSINQIDHWLAPQREGLNANLHIWLPSRPYLRPSHFLSFLFPTLSAGDLND